MERMMKGRLNGLKNKLIIVAIVVLFALGLSYAWAEENSSDSAFDGTEALIELLKSKGVLSKEEATSFLDRYRLKLKASQQVVTLVPPKNNEEIMQKISVDVTKKLNKKIKEVSKESESTSQYLARRATILEQQVEDLQDSVDNATAIREKSWANRIRFGGDIRVRHESVLFDKNNSTYIEDPSNPETYINSTDDEHRQRVRMRLGLTAKILEPEFVEGKLHNAGSVEAGVRMATGSVGNPVSTNRTLGDDDDSRSDVILDRAYLKYSYKPLDAVWGGRIPEGTITAGIMKSPWFTSSSSLVWDSDLAFEGIALNFKTDTIKANSFKSFITLGYFPIQDSEWSQDDKYMLGGQIGIEHKPFFGWRYKLAAAYYDYYNVEAFPITSTIRTTADEQELERMTPKFMQKGNSTFLMDKTTIQLTDTEYGYGLLSDFKLLNITGELSNTYFWPVYITFYWDYVRNLGYDPDAMAAKEGVSASDIKAVSGDTGYEVGLKVGFPKPRNRWEWNLFVVYKYLESDAVLDAYTDSDFHLGGTNAKGFIFGGELGLYKNVWLKARWMSANEIDDIEEINNQEDDLSVDTFQLDINAEF